MNEESNCKTTKKNDHGHRVTTASSLHQVNYFPGIFQTQTTIDSLRKKAVAFLIVVSLLLGLSKSRNYLLSVNVVPVDAAVVALTADASVSFQPVDDVVDLKAITSESLQPIERDVVPKANTSASLQSADVDATPPAASEASQSVGGNDSVELKANASIAPQASQRDGKALETTAAPTLQTPADVAALTTTASASSQMHLKDTSDTTKLSSMQDSQLSSVLFPTTSPQDLPAWVMEYSAWHAAIRQQFPDTQLLEHKNAPRLLIKMCPHKCGGLHDRMKSLPAFLYQAHVERRVLLLKWYNRFDLESFLLPNQLNWTLPMGSAFTATPEALKLHYTLQNHYANTAYNSNETRVVIHHVRDDVPSPPVPSRPAFGALWYYLFQPSPRLKQAILETFASLPTTVYNALHLRVRHPGHYNRRKDMAIDLEGFNWTAAVADRNFAITTASKALRCVREKWGTNASQNPLFVYSDSQDLVDHLVQTTRDLHLVSRNQSGTFNAHLDSSVQDNLTAWDSYAGTFLDLTVAIHAKCLALGVGNFAALAYKIGNHSCLLQYIRRQGSQAKQWGYHKLKSEYCDPTQWDSEASPRGSKALKATAAPTLQPVAVPALNANASASSQMRLKDTSDTTNLVSTQDSQLASVLFPTTSSEDLPAWLIEYSAWHATMRKQFPDTQLLEHKNAPRLLIKMCPHKCGGLHDRMSGLPAFLFQAHVEQRVLLLKWYNRFDLESFLLPNQLNWTLPMGPKYTSTPEALKLHYTLQNHYVNTTYNSNAARVVIHHVRDDVPSLPAPRPTFGALWYYLFQPSTRLRQAILDTFRSLPRTPYNALHLRVRHPAHYNRRKDIAIDLEGFNWTAADADRRFAIKTASKALRCVREKWGNASQQDPLFVYSDTQDLVDHLVRTTRDLHLVSRNQSGTFNAHLDSSVDIGNDLTAWDSYAGTFLDLTVAIHAKCLALGVGNFAALAYKIGNHSCLLQYVRRQALAKQWGYHQMQSEFCDPTEWGPV